ncbi:hypothetical protein [Bailinhaonella thermotolerans]|uniref:Uncharacterized protein n=1 Tax=Bailinhaonella thermotolerans TaxID=1070861 RepID=A0A3A4A7B6_9ACTN|nr:hypothetical protein [Bailinhaonella thermotolerans]RJL21759.1 hypothetical protein D5H75_37145 [Bailinhaonella thermotolerans]
MSKTPRNPDPYANADPDAVPPQDPEANQLRREPMPASPEEPSGTRATDVSEELGADRPAEERRVAERSPLLTDDGPTPSPVPSPGTPTSLPGHQAGAIERDDEGEEIGFRVVNAPPGKPEGEVDTRP